MHQFPVREELRIFEGTSTPSTAYQARWRIHVPYYEEVSPDLVEPI